MSGLRASAPAEEDGTEHVSTGDVKGVPDLDKRAPVRRRGIHHDRALHERGERRCVQAAGSAGLSMMRRS